MKRIEFNSEPEIMESAIKVFAEQGFHNSSMRNIAGAAGISLNDLYSKFENEGVILSKIFENIWEHLYRQISFLKGKDISPIEKINFLIDYFFDIFSANPKLAIVFVNNQINIPKSYHLWIKYYNQFLDSGEEILKDGKQNGLINKDIDIKIFRYFLFGGIRYLLDIWAKNPNSIQSSMLRQNVKQIIKRGITECHD
jgi:TetR/AcrR family transcriptional regulator, fatty acid metabolism regulator protein